jgi:signal transduction histidine kinase
MHLRISPLLSNLLGNAVTHGSNATPIIFKAYAERDEIVLSLTNQGAPIPAHLMPLLFEPFSRARSRATLRRLGAGALHRLADRHGAQTAP